MNHWPFIIGAYGLAIVGIAGVMFGAFRYMRSAEKGVPDRR